MLNLTTPLAFPERHQFLSNDLLSVVGASRPHTPHVGVSKICDCDLVGLKRDERVYRYFLEHLANNCCCETPKVRKEFVEIGLEYAVHDEPFVHKIIKTCRKTFGLPRDLNGGPFVALYSTLVEGAEPILIPKIFLTDFSPYFATMLEGGMLEATKNAVGLELTPEALRALANYIYGEKDSSLETNRELMRFAKIILDDEFTRVLEEGKLNIYAQSPERIAPQDRTWLARKAQPFTEKFFAARGIQPLKAGNNFVINAKEYLQLIANPQYHFSLEIIGNSLQIEMDESLLFAFAAFPKRFRCAVHEIYMSFDTHPANETLKKLHFLFPNLKFVKHPDELRLTLEKIKSAGLRKSMIGSSGSKENLKVYSYYSGKAVGLNNEVQFPVLPNAYLSHSIANPKLSNTEFFCRKALEYAPRSAAAHAQMAMSLFLKKNKKSHELGLSHLKKAVHLDPFDQSLLIRYRDECQKRRLWPEVFRMNNMIKYLIGSEADLLKAAEIACKVSEWKKAIKYFYKFIRTGKGGFEQRREILGTIGKIYLSSQEFDKAFHPLQQAFELGNYAVLADLGKVLLHDTEPERAERLLINLANELDRLFAEIKEKEPLSIDDSWQRMADYCATIHSFLARFYLQYGDLEKAKENMRVAESLFSSSLWVLAAKAEILRFENGWDNAIETYYHALQVIGDVLTAEQFKDLQGYYESLHAKDTFQKRMVKEILECRPFFMSDVIKEEKGKEKAKEVDLENMEMVTSAPPCFSNDGIYIFTQAQLDRFSKQLKDKRYADFDFFFENFPQFLEFENMGVGTQLLMLIQERADSIARLRSMMTSFGQHTNFDWGGITSSQIITLLSENQEGMETDENEIHVPKEQLLALAFQTFYGINAQEPQRLPLSVEAFKAYKGYLCTGKLEANEGELVELEGFASRIGDPKLEYSAAHQLIDHYVSNFPFYVSPEVLDIFDRHCADFAAAYFHARGIPTESTKIGGVMLSLAGFVQHFYQEDPIHDILIKTITGIKVENPLSDLVKLALIPEKYRREIISLNANGALTNERQALAAFFPNAKDLIQLMDLQWENESAPNDLIIDRNIFSALVQCAKGEREPNSKLTFGAVLNTDSNCAVARYALTKFCDNDEELEEELRTVLELDPKNVKAHLDLIALHKKRNDWKNVILCCKEALKLPQCVAANNLYLKEIYPSLGHAYFACEQWDEAQKFLLKSVELNPQANDDTCLKLAHSYLKLDLTDLAIRYFQELEHHHSYAAEAKGKLAFLYLLDSKMVEAKRKVQEGMALKGEKNLLRFCGILLAIKNKKAAIAEKLMKSYIEDKNPDSFLSHYCMGELCLAKGNKEEAIGSFSVAKERLETFLYDSHTMSPLYAEKFKEIFSNSLGALTDSQGA